MPLFLAFHGNWWNPDDWASHHAWDTFGARDGWVTVYPAGLVDNAESLGLYSVPVGALSPIRTLPRKFPYRTGWNIGVAQDETVCSAGVGGNPLTEPLFGASCHASCNGNCSRCSFSTCYDEAAFVSQLLRSLEGELCLNTARYFMLGESNGAMLVHHLTQKLPGEFLGAVAVMGFPLRGHLSEFAANQLSLAAPPASRTSFLQFHGRNDSWIPPLGGAGWDGFIYESLDDSMAVWAQLHGCVPNRTGITTPYDGGGGIVSCPWYEAITVGCPGPLACEIYADCRNGGRVTLCMYDGDHGAWPPEPAADGLIWSFLSTLGWGPAAQPILADPPPLVQASRTISAAAAALVPFGSVLALVAAWRSSRQKGRADVSTQQAPAML